MSKHAVKAETIIDVMHDPQSSPGFWRVSGELVSLVCPGCWVGVIFIDPKAIKDRCALAECNCGFSRVVRLWPPGPLKGGTE